MPDEVRSIEEIAALQRAKKRAKKQARTAEPLNTRWSAMRRRFELPNISLLDANLKALRQQRQRDKSGGRRYVEGAT
jgi:hypothetical protein